MQFHHANIKIVITDQEQRGRLSRERIRLVEIEVAGERARQFHIDPRVSQVHEIRGAFSDTSIGSFTVPTVYDCGNGVAVTVSSERVRVATRDHVIFHFVFGD